MVGDRGKCTQLQLEYFSGETVKPLLSKNNFVVLPYSFSSIQWSHVTYLRHLGMAYQCSWYQSSCIARPFFVIPIKHFTRRFQVYIFLMRHLPCENRITCHAHHLQRANNKLFTRLIGLRQVGSCLSKLGDENTPRVAEFSRSIST